MRSFFITIILILTVIGINPQNNFANPNENQESITSDAFDRLASGIWVSELWVNKSLDDKNHVQNLRKIHITHVAWETKVQPALKKSWEEYNNIDLTFYPSVYFTKAPGREPETLEDLMEHTFSTETKCDKECIVDNNTIVYATYEDQDKSEARKYILTPDGKMIYDGITYILVPFDKFDEFYEREIEPGPEGATASASAKATVTVNQGAVVPPKPGEGDKKSPKETANRPKPNKDDQKAYQEIMEQERRAMEALIKSARKTEKVKLDPVLRNESNSK